MKTTLLCLLVPVAVLCAGCAASSAVSKPTGGAGGCAVEIPLTSQGGGAAWAERVATEAKDEALLVAKWENPANEPWGGFGNPTVKDWQGTVDLSASKGCTLTFKDMRVLFVKMIKFSILRFIFNPARWFREPRHPGDF